MESHMNSTMKRHLDLACKKLEIYTNRMEAAEKNIEMLLNRFSLDKENESFTWNIPNLVSRLKNNESIYSEPFFLRGYRMVLFLKCAYIVGLGAWETIINVGFVMKRGKFDNELEWPFTGKLHIDLFVGPIFHQGRLGSVILQPNKAIPRPVSPNKEEGGDAKKFSALRQLKEKRFCEHFVNAKFVD